MKGNDFHRRRADAEQQDALIHAGVQHKRNAVEWLRRARVALDDGDLPRMKNCAMQAVLEMQTVGGCIHLPHDEVRRLTA